VAAFVSLLRPPLSIRWCSENAGRSLVVLTSLSNGSGHPAADPMAVAAPLSYVIDVERLRGER